MGALIWRELVAITRAPAYWVSAVLYVTALTAFVIVWGDGIPVVGARSGWEQFTMAQRVFLAMLLPWTAARCGTSSRRELTLLGFLSARSSTSVLFAHGAALAVSLMALALSALPVMALMQQIAAAPVSAVALDMAAAAVLALLVALVTVAATVALETPIQVWALSGTLTLVAALVGPPWPGAPFVFGAVLVGAWLCVSTLRSKLVYLPEVQE